MPFTFDYYFQLKVSHGSAQFASNVSVHVLIPPVEAIIFFRMSNEDTDHRCLTALIGSDFDLVMTALGIPATDKNYIDCSFVGRMQGRL